MIVAGSTKLYAIELLSALGHNMAAVFKGHALILCHVNETNDEED